MNKELLKAIFRKEENGFKSFQQAMDAPKSDTFMVGSQSQILHMKRIKPALSRLAELNDNDKTIEQPALPRPKRRKR